ncbi:tripartite tricarboxylate transporter TctB family protein [Chelatococcus daeguensis]|uniref:tripartite tricarboxylate transporter TctB family protein n=1 Tax=Chelatococcus daeguensis TaxID=444444 RepID=UPI0007AC134F|nr:tripartite tricarboxylate transporter TctB family protein [Chelatococcus daeguensis]KZE33654.1 hypothetical protein AVW15_18815 [Chelatococcus daeguensis]MBM3084761.1 tripartite tricarboxylate transporter TctB family protein [Chelatococcus daeguensis]
MVKSDIIIGFILTMLGVAVILHAQSFPAIPGQEYGAAVFPVLIAGALAICGILLAFGAWRRRASLAAVGLEHSMAGITSAGWTKGLATIALVVGYCLFADRIGFIPAMAIVLMVGMLMLGVRWWVALLVSAATILVIYQLFVVLMRVPLPRGLLAPFL